MTSDSSPSLRMLSTEEVNMSRFAFLLSNNAGLPGVKKDVADMRSFLLSCEGGAWDTGEILEKHKLSLSELRVYLDEIRKMRFDYVLFYYSGHGSFMRGTMLEINEEGEKISESETLGLSAKQLSIYDCCRYVPPTMIAKKFASVCENAQNVLGLRRKLSRSVFDSQVKAAPPQQIRLYACKVGQFANATESGSLYTQGLLSSAFVIGKQGGADPVSVHNACANLVYLASTRCEHTQTPECVSSVVSQGYVKLPFVIKSPGLVP